ncbi:XRE family transcriptional regulator [Bombiscardovia apis]|uniref:XRE family transcriptional regulator n=1 Tax=Bombiscardovia apis TaxID=2932182 RepID=A0ABN6SF68_9BIFI|nr:zinc ribbon domain-containing protein [Bombiscardovia apis]BDR54660.1 XRE family transcriptional regulator [Bombiscardovia apis]
MAIKDVLPVLRKQENMTQAELAAQLYVTRQAVSRWENGETEPSIDMVKLIAYVLQVPVIELFEAPEGPICQSCGTPFSVPDMERSTNGDGSKNPDYCQWCYQSGAFTQEQMDDLIEANVPYFVKATGISPEVAVSYLGAFLPNLKRWQHKSHSQRVHLDG